MLGFRAIDVYLERIGEIGQTLDLHVKSRELGLAPRYRAIVVAPRRRIVNRPYLGYWRPYVRIVSRGPLMPLLARLRWSDHVVDRPGTRRLDGSPWDRESAHVEVQAEWERQGRAPLLRLDDGHAARGAEAMRGLGLPQGTWFATLHVRAPGYLAETDDSHRWWRNADVTTYLQAVRAITERGGWVVRLGDPSMPPLPDLPQVIDYAHAEQRADWLDVYLTAAGRFMVGTTSGLAVVASTFGVPLVATNWLPFSSVPKSGVDIYQPKLYRRNDDGRLLTFAESLGPDLFDLHDGRKLQKLGLSVVENAPDEIEALVREMLDRVDGSLVYTEADDARQQRFRSLFRHLAGGPVARAGRAFLERYEELLPGDSQN